MNGGENVVKLLHDYIWKYANLNVVETASIALLDRSTIARAAALVSGNIYERVPARQAQMGFGGKIPIPAQPEHDLYHIDPFVAVADLAALVSAAIFYDRLFVVSPSRKLSDEFEQLGIKAFTSRIDPGDRGSDKEAEKEFGFLLQDTWSSAYAIISNNWQEEPQWYKTLNGIWKGLLPILENINLDSHKCNYTSSPNQPVWPVFDFEKGSWVIRADFGLEEMVRDNTYRSLFYVRLAQELSNIMSSEGMDIDLRYVGGCLRAPMQLVVLQANEKESVPIERELDQMAGTISRRMPFWFDAVMAQCKNKNDFGPALNRLRDIAEPLRARRKALGIAFDVGNKRVMNECAKAMEPAMIDMEKEIIKLIPKLVEASLTSVTTSIVSGASKGAISIFPLLEKPFIKVSRKLFRPHIAAIQELNDAAQSCTHSLRMAARVFNFPGTFMSQPIEFINSFGKLRWVC